MSHVTYRVPKVSASLVEKLFQAYGVTFEELSPAQIVREALDMPIEVLDDVPLSKPVALADLATALFLKDRFQQ